MSECLEYGQHIIPPTDPGSGQIDCDCDAINSAIAAKQDRLIPGTGISINGAVISATGGGAGTSGVTSFNNRTGAVRPQAGDYTAALIRTSDGKTVQQYVDEYKASAPDTAMSNTSTKAVQNKVIKAYADAIDRKTLPAGGTSGAILVKTDNTNYNTQWKSATDFMMKADYDSNRNGKVDKAENADALVYGTYKATAPALNNNTTVVVQTQVGSANGVAPLDANQKVPLANLPDFATSGLTYGGVFNANTKVATLTPAAKEILGVSSDTLTLVNTASGTGGYTANKDLYYIVNTAGSFAGKSFVPNDTLLSLTTAWDKLNGGYAGVTSVNNKTGVVSLNTNDVPQGSTNLYMTQAEKTKLAGIEANATKDLNVLQTASVSTLSDGTRVLRLTNKNGTVTTFSAVTPEGDFLTKTGNASNTYITYSPTGRRDSFTGTEATGVFARKVVDWLRDLETVAFTGSYNDLTNKPTSLSQFVNDGDGTQPFVTKTTADLLNYYIKTDVYTKQEVEDLLAAMDNFNFIVVNSLPSTGDANAIYYVPQASPATGYERWQYIQGRWVSLGNTDINPDNYLEKDGNASLTTSALSAHDSRQLLQSNDELREHFGKINKWLADLKNIAFTASWRDLTDAAELATQDDLENYVLKQWDLSQAGKALVIGNDGNVTTANLGETVIRKGDGFRSIVGNDHPEDRINDADGQYAAAFGNHTIASGDSQFARGEWNEEDTAGAYYDIVGMGTSSERKNAYTLSKTGKGYFFGGAGASATYVPSVDTDFTTKRYVDDAVANAGNLRKQVVTVVPSPAAASENVIYLLQDPHNPEVYQQWMKILIGTNPDMYDMIQVGTTETDLDDYQLKEPGDLNTTAVSVSGAINELLAMIGDLDDLETSVKTDVVAAINSIKGGVAFQKLVVGENVRDYADGVKDAYVLTVPAGINGNPSATESTVISIPTPTKDYYYQFGMSGNVDVYFRRQPKAYAAELDWRQMAVESIQQSTMPTPDSSAEGKVYQYTGSTNAQYVQGVWYKCENQSYAAWLEQETALTYYTKDAVPAQYAMIYDSTFAETANVVDTVSGIIMTDLDGDRYTRNSASDVTRYQWTPLQLHTSDLINNGNGTGEPGDFFVTDNDLLKDDGTITAADSETLSQVNMSTKKVKSITFINLWNYIKGKITGAASTIVNTDLTANRALVSNASGKVAFSPTTSTELSYVHGVTSAIQTQLNEMWKKIYPVGAIYISTSNTSPATLFGGTWTAISDGYYLRAITSGTAGTTMSAQLPNVTGSFRFSSGSQGHPEVSSPTGAFKTATNGNLTYPWPSDGTSGGPRTVNFALKNFNNDLYIDNGEVRPNSFKVFMWRRTS